MHTAASERLIHDLVLLLANRQDSVDSSQWEKNSHATRVRIDRELESLAAAGYGTFQWRRTSKGKGHRVFVFNDFGKESAKLRGEEWGYYYKHYVEGWQPPAQEELANNKVANSRLPRDESVLVLACTVAKGYGCYFNPGLFFQLGRTLGPNLPPHDITSRQITQQLKKLVVKGYMIFEGTKLVRGRRIPLYYPTDLGFQRFDLRIKQMPGPTPTLG